MGVRAPIEWVLDDVQVCCVRSSDAVAALQADLPIRLDFRPLEVQPSKLIGCALKCVGRMKGTTRRRAMRRALIAVLLAGAVAVSTTKPAEARWGWGWGWSLGAF